MIVLDLETTGTDPQKHAIVSIGALELENPENDFYAECQIWDGAKVEQSALNVNGFTFSDITDPTKQPLTIALEGLSSWIQTCKDKTLAGHNISFDTSFLISGYARINKQYPFAKRVIDTHSLTYIHMIHHNHIIPFDEKNRHSMIDSDTVFKYVGIPSERSKHNALEDARLTAESINRLLYSKKLLESYSKFEIPWL